MYVYLLNQQWKRKKRIIVVIIINYLNKSPVSSLPNILNILKKYSLL